MKRIFCMILALLMVVPMFAGCGSTPAVEESTAPTAEATTVATEPPTEATTEPTLSPEEILYNSLSDRMKTAVDLGLVALADMENPDRVVTVGEAAAMLQKAFVHRTGVKSNTLNDLMNISDYAARNATRGWIVNVPGLADMELLPDRNYESYEQWVRSMNSDGANELWYSFRHRLNMTSFAAVTAEDMQVHANGEKYLDRPGVYNAQDLELCLQYIESDLLYGHGEKDRRFGEISDYAFQIYDQTDGRKFFEFEDGYVNPEKELTLADAAEYALTYYNFPNPMAYPDYVAPEEVGAYNSDIITVDLLEKETDLPEASCQNLPDSWHGVVMDDFQYAGFNMHPDFEIYEYEIQQVKEAGFNFIGLNLDFSWLQESVLNDKELGTFDDLMNKEDVGKLSRERLEKLDQVIAWCMKYDIHVNLRATAPGGVNDNTIDWNLAKKSEQYADELAILWQAIARRYADIPNTYLSFTLFTGEYAIKNSMVVPSVAAIREVSPDRCIIADICSYTMKAKEFAELGVALSYKLYDLEKVDAVMDLAVSDYWSNKTWTMSTKGQKVVAGFEWPYRGKVDAQALFNQELYAKMESLVQVAEIAKEYGVGFMLGDFGVSYGVSWWWSYDRVRYSDEPYAAMITDIVSTIEDMGYGWCFARWYGPFGLAFYLPANTASAYVQVEDYNYYIDQAMLELFQNLNGVA